MIEQQQIDDASRGATRAAHPFAPEIRTR